MSREEIIELMKNVPGSYDDFVSSMTRWMEKDEGIRFAVLDQISKNPYSDTDELTKILWDHLGIGEPLPLADDDLYPVIGQKQAVN